MTNKTYKPGCKHISVLVAGSNRDGNDLVKKKAVKLFQEAGFEVHETCDIFRSWESTGDGWELNGKEAIRQCIQHIDFFYVVASVNGYTGFATASRFALLHFLDKMIISSHKLAEEDLTTFVSEVVSPEKFPAWAKEFSSFE